MAVYLLDTNILLRLGDVKATSYALVRCATEALLERQDDMVMVPQVLYEFWVVATRPIAQNGLAWTAAQARQEIALLSERFELLFDPPDMFTTWLELVFAHEVLGKQAHDARLVAAMRVHNIERLLMLNAEDFRRYPKVKAVHPSEVTP